MSPDHELDMSGRKVFNAVYSPTDQTVQICPHQLQPEVLEDLAQLRGRLAVEGEARQRNNGQTISSNASWDDLTGVKRAE